MAVAPPFCRELAGEASFAGTACDGVRRWVLVEDSGRWGAKTPGDCQLPASLRSWLVALDAEPGTRVQLIRRPTKTAPASTRRRVILVEAALDPAQRRLVELNVELAQIPALDLDELLASAAPVSAAPVWLVCTHGARDRCCAKWGMPVWQRLFAVAPERVWQSSHLGGHRFAPAVLCLPQGLMWGRVEPQQILALDQAMRQDRIVALDKLRGRCALTRAAQAAECLLRVAEQIEVEDELVFLEVEAAGDTRIDVHFSLRSSADEVVVALEQVSLPPSVGSCGDEPQRRRGYRLASPR